MNEQKSLMKRITSFNLFLPLFCLALVLLANGLFDMITHSTTSFFKISFNNGVLFGRIIDVLNRGSEIAILAVGMTLVIAVSGGTDISVGSVMSLCACMCCMLLAGFGNSSVNSYAIPLILGVLAGVLMGGICGAFNGALVSKLKIQPMVATLILYTAARAIGLVLCNNLIVYIRVDSYKVFGNFWGACPIPTPILMAIVTIIVVALVLRTTSLGLYIKTVGINSRAARLMGINSDRICFICYTICGLCAGVAGIVNSSRIYSADANNIGLNYELDAILAVALGGNSLAGGKFSLAGSIIGAYTIQALTTTLLAMGVTTEQAPVFKAIAVILIVAIQAPAIKSHFSARRARLIAAKGVEVK